MKNNTNYSITKTNIKSLKNWVLVFISLIIAGVEVKYPVVYASIGFILTFIYDYLKHKWEIKLP